MNVYELAEKFSLSWLVGGWVVDFLLEYRWAAYIVRSISGHFWTRAQRKTFPVSQKRQIQSITEKGVLSNVGKRLKKQKIAYILYFLATVPDRT